MNTNQNTLIDALGGTGAVAVICDVSPQAVSQWRTKGIPKPWLMYFREIRPDLFSKEGQEVAEDKPSSPPQKSEHPECASCPDRTKCEKRTGLVEPCELILKKRKSDWTD